MRLILLNRGGRSARCLDLSAWGPWVAGVAVVAVLVSSVVLGYSLASIRSDDVAGSEEIAALQADLLAQRELLAQLNVSADEHIDALALRLGDLNANVIRLNALGSRLTGMAKLDDGEFDFANPPAVGGPADPELALATGEGQLPELLVDLNSLEATLDDQEQQLAALEGLLLNRRGNAYRYTLALSPVGPLVSAPAHPAAGPGSRRETPAQWPRRRAAGGGRRGRRLRSAAGAHPLVKT